MPACGVTPLAIAKAIAKGRATTPTTNPAIILLLHFPFPNEPSKYAFCIANM